MGDLWNLVRARFGTEVELPAVGIEALEPFWTFRRSSRSAITKLLRSRAQMWRRMPFPNWRMVAPVTARARWSALFLYCPDGNLTPSNLFMIQRLRSRDAGLLVVCATPTIGDLPPKLFELSDALVWKALSGFDFSAYAVAIDLVVRLSPGADLLLVNDSVLGPFGDVDSVIATMPWDLSGFTASGQLENHIQSYAFHIRQLDLERAADFAPAISTQYAFEKYRDVIYAQETQFARTGARAMTAGALWFGSATMGDPSVHTALPLVQNGFPFLKRKLFSRDKGMFPEVALRGFLEEQGHPLL